jgi:predicted AlkP superfamily pyrophosphatase or phosphodiesterase
VLVLTIDQFRGDYLERFRGHFVPGGFRRLLEQGASFTDCRYRHAVTKTACGHAVVLTGVHANEHGIVNNAWTDRETLKRGNCVDDSSVQLIGRPESRGGVKLPGTAAGASPRRLLASTVGDELKLRRPASKVIGISSKDRSAILLSGKLADAAYWMDKGTMVSSTHYMKELPEWVRAFNATGRVESYFGKTWDRLLPAAAYDKLQGPDDMPGEFGDFGMGQTFPRVVKGGSAQISSAYYEAFEGAPFKNEVLLEFARGVVENENLGRRGVTDLLCLSFSTNDVIGHNYGPDSHEVMDITLRTDRMLAEFLTFLDQRVGLKNCTIVFTADHGIAPLPERVKSLNANLSAGRVDNVALLKTCEDALNAAFGPLAAGRRWLIVDENWLFFQRDVLKEKNVASLAAEKVVRDALLTIEFVEAAYTRTDLNAGTITGPHAEGVLLSHYGPRSGDVYYHMKPFWVERKTGTNHGTPYTYDTHVPLVWFGVGVKPGVYPQRVGVDDIAPTLARILGLLAPPLSRGNVLFTTR